MWCETSHVQRKKDSQTGLEQQQGVNYDKMFTFG